MSPIDFCVAGDFGFTLIACYNFDPLFFERVALPPLQRSGSQRILILADPHVTREFIERWAGQTDELGRHYLLTTPHRAGAGAFHPKFMLRVGRQDGAFWLGSGNLSAGGWGLNHEVATWWPLGPTPADPGAWLDDLLSAVQRWTLDDELAQEFLHELTERRWWPAGGSSSVLLQEPARPCLARQLEERWHGRRFHTLYLATGSTDRQGRLLRWASDRFGVHTVVVLTDPAWATLDPQALERLSLDIGVVPEPGNHAKFYWFEGDDGAAAVMGSANCSSAAWFGTNIEAIVVYDRPTRDAFEPLLSRMSNPQPPAEVLRAVTSDDEDATTPAPRWCLTSARLDGDSHVRICVAPPPPAEATLTLCIDRQQFPLFAAAQPGRYIARVPDTITGGAITVYCRVIVHWQGETSQTDLRWLDDVIALNRTAAHRSLAASLADFEGNVDESQHDRIVREVRLITDAIFDGGITFADPLLIEQGAAVMAPDRASESEATPLDPARMIGEPAPTDDRDGDVFPIPLRSTLPLLGVMEALFGRMRLADIGRIPDDEADDGTTPSSDAKAPARRLPSPETKARLAQQITHYLNRLGECDTEGPELRAVAQFTARTLVQAAAYPLALIVIGLESGWIEPSDAEAWVQRDLDLLFHHRLRQPPDLGTGILNRMQRRYAESGKEATFDAVVGDGTLWLTCCAALAALPSPQPGTRAAMNRLMSWNAIYAARSLLREVEPAHLRMLSKRLRAPQARALLHVQAPRASRLIAALTDWLDHHGPARIIAQSKRPLDLRPGDPLWSKRAGWAVVLEPSLRQRDVYVHRYASAEDTKIRPSGFYVSLRHAAKDDDELALLLGDAGIIHPSEMTI